MRIPRLSSTFCRAKSIVRCMSSSSTPIHPRAAVAATVQWTCPDHKHHYLLVQRKNPPDEGRWSPAGGKILLGETTLDACKRELKEETLLEDCQWHPNSFLTTDAIFASPDTVQFHYVIAHCFAKAPNSQTKPTVVPSDDALDADWYTLEDLRQLDCSEFTFEVLERAEAMVKAGLLPV